MKPDGFVPNMPNCGVVAMAMITGWSYDTVWAWFKARHKHRKSWRGRTRLIDDAIPCASDLGTPLKMLTLDDSMTLSNWVDWHTVPGVVYMVRVSGHAMCVKDATVYDNIRINGCDVNAHPKARARVTHVWVRA